MTTKYRKRKRDREGYRSIAGPCKYCKKEHVFHTESNCFQNPESINYKPNLAKKQSAKVDDTRDLNLMGDVNYGMREASFFKLSDVMDEHTLNKEDNEKYTMSPPTDRDSVNAEKSFI
jgi:hypothetical protein